MTEPLKEHSMRHAPQLAFLDFEASSLGDAGWPVEIGISRLLDSGEIDTQSHLIRPHLSWSMNDWSEQSASVHRIPHGFLLSKGKSVHEILDWFHQEYGVHHLLVSDNPSMEQRWLGRIFTACDANPIPPVFSMHAIFKGALSGTGQDYAYETLASKKPHRAGPDSRLMAKAWKKGLEKTNTS